MARRLTLLATRLGAGLLLLAASAGPLYGAALPATALAPLAVGQTGTCVPDLSPNGIAPTNTGGNADPSLVSNPVTGEQVRLGTVPPPPFGQLLARGGIALQPVPSGAGDTTVQVYETTCAPVDLQEFYVAVLRQNQWRGGFTPANGAAGSTQRPAPPGAPILFDLASMISGSFVNTNPTSDVVAGITVLAAIVAPGADAQHPTYVQVITRRVPRPDAPPSLTPPVSTTPNVGASGGP